MKPESVLVLGPDGGMVTDTACNAAILRGNWDWFPFGPRDLTLLPDEGGKAAAHAGECKRSSRDR